MAGGKIRGLVNGAAGIVSIRDGQPFSVGGVTGRSGKIVEIDILADPARLRRLDLTVLDNRRSRIVDGPHREERSPSSLTRREFRCR
jgi:hypothetical protein